MSLPTGFVILGAPGVGKTRVALALAEALARRGQPVFVLHTDLLKVTLRARDVEGLEGPGYLADALQRCAIVRPDLLAQWEKARRDGYLLIVEGTLALGFQPEDAQVVLLECSEEIRAQRIKDKHPSARNSLESLATDADRYAELAAAHSEGASGLDGNQPVGDIVRRLLDVSASA